MVGMTRPGAFAEFMSIPESALDELPAGMDSRMASLTEPAATAVHAIHLAQRSLVRPLAECRVLVIGGGAIGLLSALLLRSYGCRAIALAETNALRRASAASTGACEPFDPVTQGGPKESSCEFVIDAVGAKATRAAAFKAVKPGGVVLHIGLQDWASEIDMRKLTLAEITLVGTYTYSTADLRAAVAALAAGSFGDLAWVEERPLSAGAAAFRDLHEGRSAAAKIVLRPGS
jgi:alcohol dehydrogenase